MSFRRRDTVNHEMDLEAVLSFLRILLCMSAGITALVIIGMILSVCTGRDSVIYQMTLAVNLILLICGGFSFTRLRKKFEILEKKKEQNAEYNNGREEAKA